ncbi:MAG: efflux transporter outer membrane subunit, partial [Planctomycetota bacterium]
LADAEQRTSLLGAPTSAWRGDNFTIAAAFARLQQAQALLRRQRSDLFPALSTIGNAGRVETNSQNDRTDLSLGLAVSYEVDVWGRIRNEVEAERLAASATAADLQTVAITLSAEVAQTWLSLVVARQQLELLASQLETNQTVLVVLERRFAAGQSGSADVLRQRQLVESSREQILLADADAAVLEHQLAVLQGLVPTATRTISPETNALPSIPPLPATGVPSQLLQRRPDVLAAELRLLSADRALAAAVRDQYPTLDLTASITTAAEQPADLFDDFVASIAGQAVAPLIDGGLRRSEVARSEAVRLELLADYGQTVLIALQEVEDALVVEALQVERIDNLQTQRDLAATTYNQLRTQYLNGVADFLSVLSALQSQQQLERDLLTAQLQRAIARVDLYRALAGGFELPTIRDDLLTTEAADG